MCGKGEGCCRERSARFNQEQDLPRVLVVWSFKGEKIDLARSLVEESVSASD